MVIFKAQFLNDCNMSPLQKPQFSHFYPSYKACKLDNFSKEDFSEWTQYSVC